MQEQQRENHAINNTKLLLVLHGRFKPSHDGLARDRNQFESLLKEDEKSGMKKTRGMLVQINYLNLTISPCSYLPP